MFFQSFIVAGLAALALAQEGGRKCGAPSPSAEQLEDARLMAEDERAASASRTSSYGPHYPHIVVDTVFHVLASGKKLKDGYVTNKMLKDQLAVMNDNYAPYGIAFNLVNTTRTINKAWANGQNELARKTALRQGDYKTLNVYFAKDLGNLYGQCFFPEKNVAPGSHTFIFDGCSILYSTLPGGSETNYNLGKTVTHEVGHWFNLFHTFQDGCNGGDHIDDTPAERTATTGCPRNKDTCRAKPGKDPIHNYMDYSYDSCYEEFTEGQRVRMHNAWRKFRLNA